MNQLQEYIAIIHNRQQNPLPEGQYGERHHIIPRSCGGPDRKWNVVRLTPEEHFRVHCLLPEIYTTGVNHQKMVFARRFMAVSRKGIIIYPVEYGKIRREYAQEFSKMRKEHPSPGMTGKHHTEEWKKQQSERQTGFRHTEESKQKISNNRKGKPSWNSGITGCYSEETRKRMSESATGRKHTEEWKRKVSEKLKGHPNWGPKVAWNRGLKASEETRRRLSESHKGKKRGPMSEEAKRKMSEAQKARQERLRQERKATA